MYTHCTLFLGTPVHSCSHLTNNVAALQYKNTKKKTKTKTQIQAK